MKRVLWSLVIVAQLNGASSVDEKPMSCHEIMKKIDVLEKKKNEQVTANLANFFFGGNYAYNQERKKLDAELRVLKLKLPDCK